MKKLVTIFGMAILASTQVQAQAYLSIGVGQNICLNSNDPNGTFTNSTNGVYTLQSLNLGRGFEPRLNIGYMFSKHVGAELGFGYLMGKKHEFTDTQNGSTQVGTWYSRIMKFSPAVVISGGFEKLNPYGKFGLNVGMGSIHKDYTLTSGSNKTEMASREYGAKGIGMFGGFGVEYFVNKKAVIFLEIQASNLSMSPSKGEITEFTYNGQDQLASFTTYDKEIEFVKEYNDNVTQPSSEPEKVLRPTYSFGANNISLGFRFRF